MGPDQRFQANDQWVAVANLLGHFSGQLLKKLLERHGVAGQQLAGVAEVAEDESRCLELTSFELVVVGRNGPGATAESQWGHVRTPCSGERLGSRLLGEGEGNEDTADHHGDLGPDEQEFSSCNV